MPSRISAVGRTGARRERGAVAVEMALVLVVLTPLLFGMLQYGWYFFAAQSASSTARDTARRLSVGDCQTAGAAQQYAQRQAKVPDLVLTFGSATDPTTNVLPPAGDVLKVRVTANGNILGYLPMPSNGQIVREVETLVEDNVAGASC